MLEIRHVLETYKISILPLTKYPIHVPVHYSKIVCDSNPWKNPQSAQWWANVVWPTGIIHGGSHGRDLCWYLDGEQDDVDARTLQFHFLSFEAFSECRNFTWIINSIELEVLLEWEAWFLRSCNRASTENIICSLAESWCFKWESWSTACLI